MAPTVSRAELSSDDIVAETGIVPMRKNTTTTNHGTVTSACTGKVPHASKADAEVAQRHRRQTGYRCRFCRCWHNGGR